MRRPLESLAAQRRYLVRHAGTIVLQRLWDVELDVATAPKCRGVTNGTGDVLMASGDTFEKQLRLMSPSQRAASTSPNPTRGWCTQDGNCFLPNPLNQFGTATSQTRC